MFLLRGAVISLEVFFLSYVLLSAAVVILWRLLGQTCRRSSAPILFWTRMLPLLGATTAVACFILPSFLYLEPHAAEESIGAIALLFALCGALLLAAGCGGAMWAWRKTSQLVVPCLQQARRLGARDGIAAYEFASAVPAVLVTGIWRPKLLLSKRALELLDDDEMHAAIRHEAAHVRRRDNLKKLALRFCRFPGLNSLEREWLGAAEMTADDDAAGEQSSALELASALLKMARGPAQPVIPELGMTLIPERGAAVAVRIERLLNWEPSPPPRSRHYPWALLLGSVVAVAMHYAWVLVRVHEFTEFLVR